MSSLAPLATLSVPLLAGLLLSLGTTALVYRYAQRRLLDQPNARSSHQNVTPRGGGLGFVVVILAAIAYAPSLGWLSGRDATALLGAGALVAAIGFIDDHRPVAARWRLLVHAIAAGWGLAWLGGTPPLGLEAWLPTWLLDGLVWLGLIWLLNLYNFMDGIDGLAATEACCVLGGGLMLGALTGQAPGTMAVLALAGGAIGAFLAWNRPPARLFMGDVGSGFLGVLLGLLALLAARHRPELLWGWLLLLSCFIADASWTLLRRLLRGERLHEAHRSHGYQHAARRWSHGRVTVVVALINLLLLTPLALLVAARAVAALPAIAAVGVVLLLLLVGLRAGKHSF